MLMGCHFFVGFPCRQVVHKWAGSIEIGVTTHRPDQLEYPATMTNIRFLPSFTNYLVHFFQRQFCVERRVSIVDLN